MAWLDSPHSGAGEDSWRLYFTKTNIRSVYESGAANEPPRCASNVHLLHCECTPRLAILENPYENTNSKIVQNNFFDAKAKILFI